MIGAVELPIRFNLMVLPGTEHREIRDVYSHPQVLAQCRQFLLRHKLEPVPYPDTAGAARMLAEKKLKSAGAIGSRLSAELYNLDIVKEDIGGLEQKHDSLSGPLKACTRRGRTQMLRGLLHGAQGRDPL